MREAAAGDFRQKREIAAQALRRRGERRLPIVERLAVSPAMIDCRDENVARPCVKTRQQALSRAPEDRDRKLRLRCVEIAVAPDDWRSVSLGRGLHAIEDRRGGGFVLRPDRIDDGDRPAAHRSNVGDVHHHAAPAREPRIGSDEGVDESFDRKQEMPVAIGNGGAVVADWNRRSRKAEARRDDSNLSLGSQAKAVARRLREGVECAGVHLMPPCEARHSRLQASSMADKRSRSARILRCGRP